jgi:hypothetical protein
MDDFLALFVIKGRWGSAVLRMWFEDMELNMRVDSVEQEGGRI